MLESPNKNQLKQARIEFFDLGKQDTSFARKEILDSWIRSKGYNLKPDDINQRILTSKELSERIKNSQCLYDISVPIMEGYYEFLAGSGFILILADADGNVLKTLGDEDVLEVAKTQINPITEGANRHEYTIGTNAIGTSLVLKKPTQVWADEHFYSLSQNWSCSSAPILGENDEVLGALCLSGTWNRVNPHTLGMTTAAAASISKQIQLSKAYSTLKLSADKLQTAIDSLPDGCLFLDSQLKITQVNSKALSLLKQSATSLLNNSITSIIPAIDFGMLKQNMYDIETDIIGNNTTVHAFFTIKQVLNPSDQSVSFLLFFREDRHVRKLAHKMIGSNARFNFNDILGNSPEILKAKHIANIASQNNSTVLLMGESGTGKELFAQSIHNNSSYSSGPFVAINCAALPRSLIESELFGYVGGAFTGAKKEGQAGKFELANGGTLFLDEIGDMPYDVQVSLLRILQTREIVRIGGSKAVPIDVRIISATNVNLEEAIENKTFRADLYYRLNVFNIKIPSLKERSDDILLLSQYFIEKSRLHTNHNVTKIDDEAQKALLCYNWPGNIRELENAIERACLLATGESIHLSDLPKNVVTCAQNTAAPSPVVLPPTDKTPEAPMVEFEKALIIKHLIASKGNIKKAAESLNVSRRTLYRKLDRYGIDYDKLRSEDIKTS